MKPVFVGGYSKCLSRHNPRRRYHLIVIAEIKAVLRLIKLDFRSNESGLSNSLSTQENSRTIYSILAAESHPS